MGLLILTGLAVTATIIGDVVRRYWRSAKQPVVLSAPTSPVATAYLALADEVLAAAERVSS